VQKFSLHQIKLPFLPSGQETDQTYSTAPGPVWSGAL